MELFYLGTPCPHWLALPEMEGIPLFISKRRLDRLKKLPRAKGRWALDSGGFTELSMYGKWKTSLGDFARKVTDYYYEIGQCDFIAIQDWMCEPHMIAKTGLTVRDHQKLTTQNYIDLVQFAGDLPWLPVLQGYSLEEYLWHADYYKACGAQLDLVGLGSVCRRQGTNEIYEIVKALYELQLRLHAFGVKTQGLKKYGGLLHSADSMAWSIRAKYSPPLEGCTHQHCTNCLKMALKWRKNLIGGVL